MTTPILPSQSGSGASQTFAESSRSLDFDFLRRVDNSFFGLLTNHGPKTEDIEFTDSRYWVKELLDTTVPKPKPVPPLTDTSATELAVVIQKDVIHSFTQFPRWLPAVNLAEFQFNHIGESHNLPVDESRVVHVHHVETLENWGHHFFTSGGAGGGVSFCIVRETWAAPSKVVGVHFVQAVGTGYQVIRPTEATTLVKAWPGTLSEDYTAFTHVGNTLTGATSILPLYSVGGMQYIQQLFKRKVSARPRNVRITDCVPVEVQF